MLHSNFLMFIVRNDSIGESDEFSFRFGCLFFPYLADGINEAGESVLGGWVVLVLLRLLGLIVGLVLVLVVLHV